MDKCVDKFLGERFVGRKGWGVWDVDKVVDRIRRSMRGYLVDEKVLGYKN